ncbi:integrase core domain-containing protein [Streptomyces sp. NPDC091376]|uniref:integrase core domain-containing protein n=1 Tax=Streptomyces sp. NPDC091376 TaxID=3365994 RepID=UPI0037FB6344
MYKRASLAASTSPAHRPPRDGHEQGPLTTLTRPHKSGTGTAHAAIGHTLDLVLRDTAHAAGTRSRTIPQDQAPNGHGTQNALMSPRFAASSHAPGSRYDNAMAEALNGTFKAELIEMQGPWKDADQVERAIFQWVTWHNEERLHSALDYVPPAEYEEAFWRSQEQTPQSA